MAQEEYERNQEMWKLRHIEGWTNTAIGNKWGISRERVRQIIGNTGKFFRREWTTKLKESGRISTENLTWRDIDNLPGTKKVWRETWSMERHMSKSGNIMVNQEFENLASSTLSEHNIRHEIMPSRYPYSIRISNGVRVDVHIGNTNMQSSPSQTNLTYPTWKVPNINPEPEYDFLWAFIPDGYGYTYFIIPHEELEHLSAKRTANIRIPWPPMSGERYVSKWHKYHERIDLLESD